MDSGSRNWLMVIVTCPSSSWARALQKELNILQKKKRISEHTVCLALEDPVARIGSGGATLNALLVAAEYWSSLKGYSTVTIDVLQDADILIFHHGRHFAYDPCGRAFLPIPSASNNEFSGITSNLEHLLNLWTDVKRSAPPGIWVSSTDAYISPDVLPSQFPEAEAVVFTAPCDATYAANHGVVITDGEFVKSIVYCGTQDELADAAVDGTVPVICGAAYFSLKVAESLLSLHRSSPVDSCTYFGVDTGEKPIQVSLFFDIMVAMATGVNEADFRTGKCGMSYSDKHQIKREEQTMAYARGLMWTELHKYKLGHLELKAGYKYLSDELPIADLYSVLELQSHHVAPKTDATAVNSLVAHSNKCDKSAQVINTSVAGDGSLVLEAGVILTSVYLNIPRGETWNISKQIAMIGFPIPRLTHAMLGTSDCPKVSFTSPDATVLNRQWPEFFKLTGITESDLWPSDSARCLYNAKLYPKTSVVDLLWLQKMDKSRMESWRKCERVSLEDLVSLMDPEIAFELRHGTYAGVTAASVQKLCPPEGDSYLPYMRTACVEGYAPELLAAMDSAAAAVTTSSGEAARHLATIADLLGCMAGPIGGVRSGPAANPAWQSSLQEFESGSVQEGVWQMSKVRLKWMDTPSRLVRAARHYERAAQVLIRRTVMSAKSEVNLRVDLGPPAGTWVEAECPARVDLMGGWSDTPPICYELGGSVVNAAISVDGKRPIGARACKITDLLIRIVLGDGDPELHLELQELSDMCGYDNPGSPGALLKACLITSNIISLEDIDTPLPEQLQKLGGGIDLRAWSSLPQGSGLGTSSILAAAVLAALWTVTGRKFDRRSLLHAVMCTEQVLTTGGGWQDQVGGVLGGIKCGYSEAKSDPVAIEVEPIDANMQVINEHLVMIYSGKVRLARNLLQNVIRNWYARSPDTVQCFSGLIKNAASGATAIAAGDLAEVGRCMNEYWELKKMIASGCEPALVHEIMRRLEPITYGQILAGAGGGGFMLILTKRPNDMQRVTEVVSGISGSDKVTFHSVKIDTDGLTVKVGGNQLDIPYKY